MAKYSFYILYGKDKDGRFTVPHPKMKDPISFSADDLASYQRRRSYSFYSYDDHHYIEASMIEYHWGRWKNPEWRQRETDRFTANEYSPLPWPELEPIEDHFAHVSVEKGAMVSYTPDSGKGELDIQVRVKPGRYLTKFYPHLSADLVREMVCMLDKANEVRFATTPDDIELVYRNGPRSCMSHPTHHFVSSVHPTRVYGAGDLALAYLSTMDITDPAFKASARAIVWPAKMHASRIYGDQDRLGPALLDLGYQLEASLDGAKLLRIPEGSGFVCPYVDWHDNLSDTGEYLVIDAGGDLDAQPTTGVSGPSGRYCPRMDDYFDEEDVTFYYVRDIGDYWSEHAVQEYAYHCDGSEDYFSNDHPQVEMADGTIWSQRHFDNYGFHCPKTDQNLPDVDGVYLRDEDIRVSREWAEDNAYLCDTTYSYYAVDPHTPPEQLKEAA